MNYVFQLVAIIVLLSLSVNYKVRFISSNEAHFGGADYALTVFSFLSILLTPFVIYRLFSKESGRRRRFLIYFLILLVAPYVASLHVAVAPEYTWLEIFRLIALFNLIFIFLMCLQMPSVNWIYYPLAFVLVAQTIVIFLQIVGILPQFGSSEAHFRNESVLRFTGLLGHPNVMSSVMNVIASFMLAGIYYASPIPKKFFVFGYLLASALVLLTFSRTGLAVLVATSLYLVLMVKGYRSIEKKYLFLVTFTIAGLIAFTILGDGFLYRIFEGKSAEINSRFTLNKVAFDAFRENIFVGAGGNNFIYFSNAYDGTRLTEFWKAPVHNVYLLVAAETGMLGLACFFTLIGIVLFKLRLNSRIQSGKVRLLNAGAEAAFIGILIGSMFGYFSRQDLAQPLLALIFAIALAENNRSRNRQDPSRK